MVFFFMFFSPPAKGEKKKNMMKKMNVTQPDMHGPRSPLQLPFAGLPLQLTTPSRWMED